MGKRIAVMAALLAVAAVAVAATTESDALVKGRRGADVVIETLAAQIAANVQESGADKALERCKYQALGMMNDYERQAGVRMKRTSLRLRNPANAPDAFEKEALERLGADAAAGKLLPTEEIKVGSVEGQTVYRYIHPIFVEDECLPCHGRGAELSAEVNSLLQEKYPDDRAVGYKKGELRGIVSISIPVE